MRCLPSSIALLLALPLAAQSPLTTSAVFRPTLSLFGPRSVQVYFDLIVTAAAFGASSRWAFVPGPLLLAEAALMIWGSRVGKVRLRERVLDAIPWRGDETVLDVGCGRGLMLIGAAQRLSTGRAHGVDLWK